MQYYTRSFHMSLLPYELLDEFTVHEEAERFSEDFYQKVLEEKRAQYRKIYSDFEDGEIFSGVCIAGVAKLMADLPGSVEIADCRVFFLKAMAPSVWKYFKEEARKQEIRYKLLFEKLEKREQEDRLKMPEHWLPLFDLAWQDGVFFLHAVEGDRITATVRDEFCNIMDLTFFGAEWYAQEEEEMPTRILFTEVLWENGKLRLNILTRTNEYSILAEDVKCVWMDEDEVE